MNSVLSDVGVGLSIFQLSGPQWSSGITGLVPAAANWFAEKVLTDAFFAGVVDVTMAIDQAG